LNREISGSSGDNALTALVKLKKKAGVAKRVRRQQTCALKAQVALDALREGKTMA